MAFAKCFYVYVHTDKNGTVFYVGKGKGKRCISLNGRSAKWKEAASDGWDFDILWCGTEEADALALESDLINNPPKEWKLVNKQDTTISFNLDKDHLSKYVYYCEESPSGLRWKTWNGQTNSSRRNPGDFAGYKNSGRWKVCISGKEMMCHRVVVALHGIDVPSNMVVNHIDNNPLNNKISNLEVVTTCENNRRMKMHTGNGLASSNTSGVNGVSEVFVKQRKGNVDVYAMAYLNNPDGKRIYKCFNYKVYGKDVAWEMAIRFRQEKFKEFYGDI